MSHILGAILAGGQSLRMGMPDKFLLQFQGHSLLQRVIDRAQFQVDELVINANGDPQRLTEYQLPVVSDLWPNHQGPLAGIISVMSWAQKACGNIAWLATFAADTPDYPLDTVARMHQKAQRENLQVVYPVADDQAHYTFALWSMALLPHLQAQFDQGARSLHGLIHSCRSGSEVFNGNQNWFFNVNSPADWNALHDQ